MNRLFMDDLGFMAVDEIKKQLLGSLSQICSPGPSFLPTPVVFGQNEGYSEYIWIYLPLIITMAT